MQVGIQDPDFSSQAVSACIDIIITIIKMTFDFVIETPNKRGINRNNNKIIQKRATQAGARTRLGNKSSKSNRPHSGSPPLPFRHAREEGTDESTLLANAKLASPYNSPFLARFGGHGQMLYVRDPSAAISSTCFRLPDPTLSILQRHLLLALAARPISRDANRLFKIMLLTQRQFLNHLPSHYGQLPFLDEAIECLIARLHDTVPLLKADVELESSNRVSPTVLYGKALTSLRSAIDTDLTHNLSYIWFAIMLLTLFELLSMGDEPGWVWHAAGSARMLYKVGPENISSEFHMSLLASQCRIMVVETIFTNKPCYLANPRWQEAIRRTTLFNSEDFADRSQVSTELWAIGARIPNLFQAVSDHVHGLTTADDISPQPLLQRLLDDFRVWRETWQDVLENTCRNVLRDSAIRHQSLMILLAFYMLSIIVHRLRIAIEPAKKLKLENEVLLFCANVFHLRRDFMSCRWSPQNNGSIYARVANGTQHTASRWKKEIACAVPDIHIDGDTFDDWCANIGRTLDRAPTRLNLPQHGQYETSMPRLYTPNTFDPTP